VHATPAGSVQRELTRGLSRGHSSGAGAEAVVHSSSAVGAVEYDRSAPVNRWHMSVLILQTAIGQGAGLQGIRTDAASMVDSLRCPGRLAGLVLLAAPPAETGGKRARALFTFIQNPKAF